MRCSVTEVEAYLYYRNNEEAELAPLLAQLRRLDEPSEAMRAGAALHKALELASDGLVHALEADGYRFLINADAEIELPELREVKAEKVYVINGTPITLVGKVDTIFGKRVDDHKTTSRYDPDRFFSSYQWRFYLDIFNADRFRWNVFEMREDRPATYVVFGFHQPEQVRYPNLAADCERVLREFVDFARVHLPERFAVAEAA